MLTDPPRVAPDSTPLTPQPHTLPHATLAPAIGGPVLLASDGSGPSDAAAIAARRAAERLGAEIEVVAVLEPLPLYAVPWLTPAVPPNLETERREALQAAVVRRLEPVLGSRERWQLDVEHGPTGRTIADAATERGAGLVVLGSGGHRTRDRLLGEEVSLQVVRHARCPVLAVAAELETPIRRAVVGVDFSAASVRAALAALALIEPGGAGAPGLLVLVHVRSAFEHAYPVLGEWATQYDGVVAEQLVHLRSMLRPHVPDGVTVETRGRVGVVPADLLAVADEVGAQLVAVGTHGPGWVERLFVGSVATGVLRHAGRSVLVTPPPGAIDRVRIELGVSGQVALRRADDWTDALDAFTRRNGGRRARLDVRDAESGVRRTEVVDYAFMGATYDRHDERVELMLGHDPARSRRLTHTIPHVRSIEILSAADGRSDELLLVRDAAGDATLTFVDDWTARESSAREAGE